MNDEAVFQPPYGFEPGIFGLVDLHPNHWAIAPKWYNLQEETKICKNFEKKKIEDVIHIIFICNKYDNIRSEAFNDINEVDNIKLQIRNKVEELKLLSAEGSLKALNIFGQFLIRSFESSSKQCK